MQLVFTSCYWNKRSLHVCKSKERYVQVCSKESKDVFLEAASPGDTDELMLSTAWSPGCCGSTDYIGKKINRHGNSELGAWVYIKKNEMKFVCGYNVVTQLSHKIQKGDIVCVYMHKLTCAHVHI